MTPCFPYRGILGGSVTSDNFLITIVAKKEISLALKTINLEFAFLTYGGLGQKLTVPTAWHAPVTLGDCLKHNPSKNAYVDACSSRIGEAYTYLS